MSEKNKKEISWAQSFKLFGRALRLLGSKAPKLLLSTGLAATLAALSPYVTIYFSARIINELAGARNPQRLITLVAWVVGSSALLGLLSGVLNRWKNKESAGYHFLREKWYGDKLLQMDFADLDRQHTHDLLSQIRQLNQWSGWGLARVYWSFEGCLGALFGILGAVALSVSLFTSPLPPQTGALSFLASPLCTVLALLLFAAFTWLSPALGNRAGLYWTKQSDDGTFGNRIFGFYGFRMGERYRAPDVRIYRQEDICAKYLTRCNSFDTRSAMAKYARGPMGLLQLASDAVSRMFTGLIYVYVCLKAWAGAFGVGSVTQYIGAITSLSGSISSLLGELGTIRSNGAFLQITFEFLDIPNSMYQGSLTTEKRSDRQYEVEFRDVSFRYPGTEDYALRHVNMKFKIGSRLAVVGENGSGKTTFIKLLCRLYDPTEGEILLNGINIRKYKYDDYMDIFSVVFQDFKLLSLPLGQNVGCSLSYDRDRAAKCLKDAGFEDRLSAMEEGLDTCLYHDFEDKGVEVSGGEAQKIAIARALYKDAPFIILDEPTAALDPVAEAEIYSRFDGIAGDKTAIYISHRLSSCRFCDEIAVFDHGQVVQKGSHEVLVADEDGKYYELWNAQAQYYTA